MMWSLMHALGIILITEDSGIYIDKTVYFGACILDVLFRNYN